MAGAADRKWRKIFESEDVRKKIDLNKILAFTQKLLHKKADLEKLLSIALVEIEFLPKDAKTMESVFCTGNIRFMNVCKKARLADKQKQLQSPFVGMSTKDPNSVDVYDVVDGHIKTISLKSWKVVFPFVLPITEDNVLVLDSIVNKYAKQ